MIKRMISNIGEPWTDSSGTVLSGVVSFRLTDSKGRATDVYDSIDGALIASVEEYISLDDNGEWSISLWPTSRGTKPVWYECKFVSDSKVKFKFLSILPEGDLSLLPFSSFRNLNNDLQIEDLTPFQEHLANHPGSEGSVISSLLLTSIDLTALVVGDPYSYTTETGKLYVPGMIVKVTANGTSDNFTGSLLDYNSLTGAISLQIDTVTGVSTNSTWTIAYTPVTNSVWGNITGTLANQADLTAALGGKSATTHTHAQLHTHTNSITLAKITEGSNLPLWNGTAWPGATGSGHTLQDEGASLPQRSKINFTGPTVTAVDDAANDATKVIITAAIAHEHSYTASQSVYWDTYNVGSVFSLDLPEFLPAVDSLVTILDTEEPTLLVKGFVYSVNLTLNVQVTHKYNTSGITTATPSVKFDQHIDTDLATTSLHHTLGSNANQAAPGNHGHSDIGGRTYTLAKCGNGPLMYESGWSHRDCSRMVKIGSTYHIYTSRSPDTDLWADTANATLAHWSAPHPEGPWTLGNTATLSGTGTNGHFDKVAVYNCAIWLEGSYIYMLYNGSDSATTLLQSSGGIGLSRCLQSTPDATFTRLDPILLSGGESEWDWKIDGADEPIRYEDNTWRIYYKGAEHSHVSLLNAKVGFIEAAASETFPQSASSWTRYSGNPVYGNGVNGSYNTNAEDPHLFVMDGMHYLCSSNFQEGGGGAAVELFLWYKSANGINGWTRAHEIEGFLTGGFTSYCDEGLGYLPMIWNNDLSYMIFEGQAIGDVDFGMYLYKYIRQGNPPALLPYLPDHLGDVDQNLHMADVFDGSVVIAGIGTQGAIPLGTTKNSIPYLDSTGRLLVECEDATVTRGILFDQCNIGVQAALLKGRKARGTITSPAAISSGDNIVNLAGDAYCGSNGYKSTGAIFLNTLAAPNNSNTYGPQSKWVFQVASDSDTYPMPLEVSSTGINVVGLVDCDSLKIDHATAQDGYIWTCTDADGNGQWEAAATSSGGGQLLFANQGSTSTCTVERLNIYLGGTGAALPSATDGAHIGLFNSASGDLTFTSADGISGEGVEHAGSYVLPVGIGVFFRGNGSEWFICGHSKPITGYTPPDAGVFATSVTTPTVLGGTGAGADLTLSSSSNGTKGNMFFGNSTYDEVNNRLGVGTTAPVSEVHVESSSATVNNRLTLAHHSDTTARMGSITGRRSGASGAVTPNGANLIGIEVEGYTATNTPDIPRGCFLATATENWDTTHGGFKTQIRSRASGTGSLTMSTNIECSGSLTSITGDFDVSGDYKKNGAVYLASGTYDPTITTGNNLDSGDVTHSANFQYLRVGSTVTVSGMVSVVPNAGSSTLTTFELSIPVASDFSDVSHCGGTIVSTGYAYGQIRAEITNNTVHCGFIATDTSSHNFYLYFTYQIL